MEERELRVLIADDHPVVRGGLIALLGTLPGVAVVGQAGSGADAVREAALTRADVVVMDVRMPGLDGVQATRRIRAEYPATAVLVLSMYDDDRLVSDALAAGAAGYLLKGAEAEEIAASLRAVAAGASVLAPGLAARAVARSASGAAPSPDPVLGGLTRRERQVLELIARGAANAAIAEELGLAGKTVGNHITAIFLKLGVASRAEAIVAAREAGLGRRP